jgi:hypothetical protein
MALAGLLSRARSWARGATLLVGTVWDDRRERLRRRSVVVQTAGGEEVPGEDPGELIGEVFAIEREITTGIEKLLKEIEA